MQTPVLTGVIRFDRLDTRKMDQTYFTSEGFLHDNPIVTSCGIFEYRNADGSTRRELRRPEDVFDPDSLASYTGKPIIITHSAGKVTKNNVDREIIGTILSPGQQDGHDVRAKIVIHDTNAMNASGLKELSLGYTLDLDETPGEWQGQKYDAIQKNIRINHLALVDSARAGENARLNIDGQDPTTKGGNKTMNALLDRFFSKRKQRLDEAEKAAADSDTKTPEELVQLVRDRRDRRDRADVPDALEDALLLVAESDDDIDTLLKAIDQVAARADFEDTKEDSDEDQTDSDDTTEDSDTDDTNSDTDDENKDSDPDRGDEDSNESKTNHDAADYKALMSVVRVGDRLNLDGLEDMSLRGAKEAVIRELRPRARFDGKSDAYVDSLYDLVVEEMQRRRTVSDQRRQMDSRANQRNDSNYRADSAASEAYRRQNERFFGGK